MFRILRTIFWSTPKFGVKEFKLWHKRFFMPGLVSVGLYCLIVLAINVYDGGVYMGLNIGFLFLLNGVGLYFAYHPYMMLGIMAVDVAEKALTDKDSAQLAAYNKMVAKVLLLLSFYTFAAATLPFKYNPAGVFVCAGAAVCLFWVDRVYKLETKVYKRAIIIWSFLMIVLSLALMIPQSVWDWAGFDPLNPFKPNVAELKVTELADTLEKAQTNAKVTELNGLIEQVKLGTISADGMKRMEQIKKEIDDIKTQRKKIVGQGVVGKVAEIFEKKEEPQPAYTAPTVQSDTGKFTLEEGEYNFTIPKGECTETLYTPMGQKRNYRLIVDGPDNYTMHYDDGTVVECFRGEKPLMNSRYNFRICGTEDIEMKIIVSK